MSKKSNQKSRAQKKGKKTVERRNRRHQYSPKPSDKPAAPRDKDSLFAGLDAGTAFLAALLMSNKPSMPWMGREYLGF